DEYEYSGFVREALEAIGKISPGDESTPTLNEKLFYIQSAFEKLSHISLGIYSLQIFTKYGMAIQKINSVHEGLAGRLFYDIAEELKNSGDPSQKIDMLLSLGVTPPEELDKILGDYINYSIADITVQNLSHGKKKIEKANKKLAAEITADVQDSLSGLRMDVTELYNLNKSLREKKFIYDKDPGNSDVYLLYLTLLDRYAALYERLWYYEGNTYIRRLNMIFIDRVREMFAAQRKHEIINIRNECIRIIEEGMEGLTVFELEGFMNGLQFGGDEFDLRNGLEPGTSKRILSEINLYLDTNIKTIREIRADMKNNIGRILGADGIPEGERKILQETVYGFDAILELLAED
ncbi:MAG: hypothetical protein R3232_13010, partial [Clostridia bacterium]|nr:hypothetical protein [Clostridia bacterium]